jgi:hypothetical protein
MWFKKQNDASPSSPDEMASAVMAEKFEKLEKKFPARIPGRMIGSARSATDIAARTTAHFSEEIFNNVLIKECEIEKDFVPSWTTRD